MTDRELLEQAAKAAGLKIRHWYESGWADIGAAHDWWNPLKDDGDALRLAVKLQINVERESAEVVWADNAGEDVESDPYAATRRAIVRAAAQKGE